MKGGTEILLEVTSVFLDHGTPPPLEHLLFLDTSFLYWFLAVRRTL